MNGKIRICTENVSKFISSIFYFKAELLDFGQRLCVSTSFALNRSASFNFPIFELQAYIYINRKFGKLISIFESSSICDYVVPSVCQSVKNECQELS